MKNKKLIKFVESFILLPVLTMSGIPMGNTVGPMSQAVANIVNAPFTTSQKQNILTYDSLALNDAIEEKLEDQKAKAAAIDEYFKARSMPLLGTGMKMVIEA